MDFNTYFSFVLASIILCVVPGPDMAYLLGRTVAQGKKAGILAALGINLGAYIHLLFALLGLSTIIATSALAFTIVKWCGAAYLIYLGISALLNSNKTYSDTISSNEHHSHKSIFWQGVISDLLNPKVALFFISLLPQFVTADSVNPVQQLITLGITVNVIALIINVSLVLAAQAVTSNLRVNNNISIYLNKLMGMIFVGLGIRLAGENR